MKAMETRKAKHISRRFPRFLRANEAVSALEYALVIGLVATAIAAALIPFGPNITSALATMGAQVTTAKDNAANDS